MLKNVVAYLIVILVLLSAGAQAAVVPCDRVDCFKQYDGKAGAYSSSANLLESAYLDTTPGKKSLNDSDHCSLSHHHHSDSGNVPFASEHCSVANHAVQLLFWNDRYYFSIGVEPSLEPPSHI